MRLAVVLLLCFVAIPATAQMSVESVLQKYNNETIPYISVDELRALQLKGEVIVLDSREQKEYDVSKIPSATLVGYSNFSSSITSEKIKEKNKLIVVYCSLGVRSEDIGEKLKQAGYSNVKNLFGGIIAWKNSGYPVLDSEGNETEKVHTSSKYWSQWLTKGKKVY